MFETAIQIKSGEELTKALKNKLETSNFQIDAKRNEIIIPVEYTTADGNSIMLDLDVTLNVNSKDNRAINNGASTKDINGILKTLANDENPFMVLLPITPRANAKSASFMVKIRDHEAKTGAAILGRISHETLANVGNGIQSARIKSQAALEREAAARLDDFLTF